METNHSILSYEELVSRIKKSDRQAFNELYERSWEKLYTQAASKLKSDDLAKDVVQDIFVDLWTKRESLAIDKITSYLSRAVKFKVIDQIRRKDYYQQEIDEIAEIIADSEFADSKFLEKELKEIIILLIERLPKKRREIFKLRFQEELTTKEISELLKISPKTVQNQTLNSISLLRSLFQKIFFTLFLFFFGS